MKDTKESKVNYSIRLSDVFSDCKVIRQTVFVDEQQVPKELEFDELDHTATHFALYQEDLPIACGRVIFLSPSHFQLGRIAVLATHRGKNIGSAIVQAMEQFALEKATILSLIDHPYPNNFVTLHINAQVKAIPFYEKLGFHADNDVTFLDANIPHIAMSKIIHT